MSPPEYPWPIYRPADHAALREAVRRVAQEREWPRRVREWDRHPAFPWEEYRYLGSLGWLGPRQPKAEGGAGWSLEEESVLVEELAYSGGSALAKMALQPDFCSALVHASLAVRERWFRPLFRGEVLVGNQITEPEAGSDAGALAMEAVPEAREGHPGYRLTGVKSQAAFAEDAQAALVYARTGEGAKGQGVSAFLVPQDLPGLRAEVLGDLGERWMRRGSVRYEGVWVPAEQRVGAPGEGFRLLQEELVHERVLLARIYLGLARASLDEGAGEVMDRRAFGRPLGSFEAVSFPLVEDLAHWEAASLFVSEAVRRLETGTSDAAARSALAKWLANSTALKVLEHAVHLTGGTGYSEARLHELRFRDALSGRVAHGSDEILKIVAARTYLGRASLPYGPAR